MQNNYKYDVAFSFTQKDEELANKLFTLLKDRISCFIYSEEQKRLAGSNGEELFNSVFSSESRIVVILYCDEWGSTKWTRIEETAIRNRGFDNGYEFTMLIPTVEKFSIPKWFPKNRIWVNLERWGITSAAASIENRVKEFDGIVKEEGLSEKLFRMDQEIINLKKINTILSSPEGLVLAFKEMDRLVTISNNYCSEIVDKTPNWNLNLIRNNKYGVDIKSFGFKLAIGFYPMFSNSLLDSFLSIKIINENLSYTENTSNGIGVIISDEFIFAINPENQNGWSELNHDNNFITTKYLFEKYFEIFLNHSKTKRLK